jgi:hypothetical protein
MNLSHKYWTSWLLLLFVVVTASKAQRAPDQIYMSNIKTALLFQQNDQQSIPLIRLQSSDALELHFDDLSGVPKNYFYTFQLCNADWTPAMLNPFDYIGGFPQNRISMYRVSSVSATRYVHYQVLLPEKNCVPTKSGNYILKVFLDNDTSKLAFTKRLYVLDEKVTLGAGIMQPYGSDIMRTHQKVQVNVGTKELNILSPAKQTKLLIEQNNLHTGAGFITQPTFIRGKNFEYSTEDAHQVFEAGKEFRWVDIRSLRFESDRVVRTDRSKNPVTITVKPDFTRNDQRAVFYMDTNGWTSIASTELINPWWQGDYAYVNFTYVPSGLKALPNKEIYLVGQLTGHTLGDTAKMEFDPSVGAYTRTLLLKQGFYNYAYLTKEKGTPFYTASFAPTEGNFWETENDYTVFYYYRSLGGRHDELIGFAKVNSRNQLGIR